MMRRNGIVRVPKLWHDAATEAFFALQEKGGGSITIPLPLKVFPYPSIRAKLLAIYPDKFVPLYFAVKPISAGGSTGTKSKGGYPVDINITETGGRAISTILHELRHVVQYLGDEVVKTKSGTFGRPSVAATRSLRARKKAIKSGKIKASGFQAYLSGASEWQPWVGTTADKIVGSIVYGKLTTTKQINDAIRTGILGSTFYTNTDPATRKELMKQVYTEIMRQLRGYTDIVPAKHAKASVGLATAKASAPKPSAPASAYAVRVKVEGAGPQIQKEATYAGKDSKGRDKLEVPAADKDAALLAAEHFADFAKQGSTLHGGTIYAVRIAHGGKESEVYVAGAKSASAPPPAAPKAAPKKPKAKKPFGGVYYADLGLTEDEAKALNKYRMPKGSTEFSLTASNGKFHVQIKPDILMKSPAAAQKIEALLYYMGWKLAKSDAATATAKMLPELPNIWLKFLQKEASGAKWGHNPRRTRRAPRRRR
jgi:hypothetical protein